MVTPQQNATEALTEWQRLRNAGLTPEERIEALLAVFFSPLAPCEVEYAAIERTIRECMADV